MKRIFFILILFTVNFLLAIPQQKDDSGWHLGKGFTDLLFPYMELSPEEEFKYCREVSEKFEANFLITQYGQNKISDIANSIIKLFIRINSKYNFRVIDSKTINAYSIAGGNIYITTGLMNFVESDDELAFILAHEIAHEECMHNKKRISAFYISPIILGSTAYTRIAMELTVEPFAKYQEYEADETAILVMKAAGYESNFSLIFLDKIAKIESVNNTEIGNIYKSHPSTSERKQKILSLLNKN